MNGNEIVQAIQTIQTAGTFYFLLEMFSAALLFSWPLTRRDQFIPRLLLGIAGLIAAGVVVSLSIQQMLTRAVDVGDTVMVLTTVGWCGVLFLLCVLLTWGLHAVRFREALYCAACAYLMEHMAYCARILLELVLPAAVMETGAPGYWITHIVIYAWIYLLYARRIIRDGKLSATAQDSLALTLVTLAVVLVMSMLATTYGFETAHAGYAIFCCGALLFGQVKQQEQIKSQSELALQRQMWSLHKTQYEMSKASIDAINRKCHDLKHQVAALKYVDPERREAVIDSLQSSVMIYDAAVETGNEILDTVLTEKSLICSRDEIALSCIADGKQLAFMDPVDLYTLVGNALDNAIEAVLPLPEAERLIRIRVQNRAGMVFLQVENPYSGSLKLQDGLPQTHKADKQNHGFGIRSMQDIAKKYNGYLKLDTEGGQFVLTLSFPLFEQQLTA